MDEKNIKERFKDMSFPERVGYIWDYYRIHILVGLFILASIGYLVNHIVFNPPKALYAGAAFFGGYVDSIAMEELENELNLQIPEELQDRFRTEVNNFYTSDNPQMNVALTQKFTAVAISGELNIIITDQAHCKGLIEDGGLMPLDSLLAEYDFPEESLFKFNGSVYGILSSAKSPLAKYETKLPVLGIMSYSKNEGATENLFLYLSGY